MAQFFRIEGASTQHQGVVPDIIFPTAKNAGKHGERALEHALPWVRIGSVQPKPSPHPALHKLQTKHQQRVAQDPGFQYLLAQEKAYLAMQAVSDISLHEIERQTERQARETQQLQRRNQFREYRGLPKLLSLQKEDDQASIDNNDDPEGIQRIMLEEAALILADSVRQQ
jgi:carboxyl-terminal processing protease